MTTPRLFVSRGFVGLRIGRLYVSLRGPSERPYFSERNRIKCHVLPLAWGWRIVVRTDVRKPGAETLEAESPRIGTAS